MSLSRIVVDNSAILPAYFPESGDRLFDAGLVTNRARALVQAIRVRQVNAYVPPSFFREFLNVASQPLYQPGGRTTDQVEHIRAQWEDLLSLPLIVVPLDPLIHQCGNFVFNDFCPAADTWYVAAAVHTRATFWISHEHSDGLAGIASKYVDVKVLSKSAPNY
jgi:hypothetical protein